MAKISIRSKERFRILRTRSKYGRKLKFEEKQGTLNELSSSLLDDTSIINEEQKEEPTIADDNIKTIESSTRGLQLSESSVVEKSKVNAKETPEISLPISLYSVVEESREDDKIEEKMKPKNNSIKNSSMCTHLPSPRTYH